MKFKLRFVVADAGAAKMVNLLLERGADPNVTIPGTGETALWPAIGKGHPAIVSALLSKGADVNVRGRMEQTPLKFLRDKFLRDRQSFLP